MRNNSVAIVTGASQGIGRATALRLAHDFSAVVLAARNQDELEVTAATVNAAGAESQIYPLDLRQPQAAEILVKGTLDCFGRIDALLNIAGAVPQIDLFEMSDEQWEDGLALKLHGARRLTIKAWDALKAASDWVVGGPNGAAGRLGMKRTSLIYKMRKLHISRPPTVQRSAIGSAETGQINGNSARSGFSG